MLIEPLAGHMPVALKMDRGVQPAQVTHRGVRLRIPHVALTVQELTLKVRHLDHVGVADADRADARRRQVQEDGGAEAARAHHEHARGCQARLAGLTNAGD